MFNKFLKKRFQDNNNSTLNKTNYQNINKKNILLSHNKYQLNKNKSYYRNKTENNSITHTNELSNKQRIIKNKNNDSININDFFYSKPLTINSIPKSPNQVYRKPIYKNNFLEVSKPANTINNNFIIYRDEINFISKENEFNINNENINIELNNNKEKVINQKILNRKHIFYFKYYEYNIQRPRIKINFISKQISKNRNILESISPMKINAPSICNFTKIFLIKFKRKKTNFIKQNNNKIYKSYKNKIKEIKSKQNYNLASKSENNTVQDTIFHIKNNNNINNDIIFLLNIITFKNILSVENQLMKLIIINNNELNRKKNKENAKQTIINEIITKINILITILINKTINEKKYIELYIKLCSDLCEKYLNSMNELIIHKYLNINNESDDKYNIIFNFKNILKFACIYKCEYLLINYNDESKEQLFNLINFVCLSFENDITTIETLTKIINSIFNQLEKTEEIEHKNYLLFLNIYFLLKVQKENNLKDLNNFVDKIRFILIKGINKEMVPKYLKRKIEEFIKIFPLKDKIKADDSINFNSFELIKEDINNYIDFLKHIDNINNNIIETQYEKQYDFIILKSLKNYKLEEIIKNYICISIDSIKKEEDIKYYKSYIKNIIEPISSKLSLSKLRFFHNKMLQILSDINQISKKNIYSFEILGYLIYLLILNELCDIKDMNIFINKDEENKVNICKIIKHIIISSEDVKKYYEEFKIIELFKNNNLFDEFIASEINSIFPKIQ